MGTNIECLFLWEDNTRKYGSILKVETWRSELLRLEFGYRDVEILDSDLRWIEIAYWEKYLKLGFAERSNIEWKSTSKLEIHSSNILYIINIIMS